jgi:hypothetical protein
LGITRLMMPSEAWQVGFAIIGAVAVGITAFLRVAGMAAPGDAGGRAWSAAEGRAGK